MSKGTIYIHKKCSTCKNALKFLEEIGSLKNYQIEDITETPPTLEELKKMLLLYEGNIKKLFNTSGNMYRDLELSTKLPSMPQEKALKLLSENGMLVKRPFLISSKVGLVGFKKAEYEKTFN